MDREKKREREERYREIYSSRKICEVKKYTIVQPTLKFRKKKRQQDWIEREKEREREREIAKNCKILRKIP